MCSASASLLEVPRSRTAIGDRSFSIAGPLVWNTLPASVRDTNSSLRFRKLLKAFLFAWRPWRLWRWTGAPKWTHLLTYLLTYLLVSLVNFFANTAYFSWVIIRYLCGLIKFCWHSIADTALLTLHIWWVVTKAFCWLCKYLLTQRSLVAKNNNMRHDVILEH